MFTVSGISLVVECKASDLSAWVRFPHPAPIFNNLIAAKAKVIKVFYSKYSNYSPEQISSESYEQISQKLLAMSDKEDITKKMQRYFI